MKIINKKDIIKILSNYDIGTYKSHEYFTAGCVQINIKVNTTKNTYALRIYRTRTIPYVKYEFNVLNYLSKKNIPLHYQLEIYMENSFLNIINILWEFLVLLKGNILKN